jgi:hypothetical protein
MKNDLWFHKAKREKRNFYKITQEHLLSIDATLILKTLKQRKKNKSISIKNVEISNKLIESGVDIETLKQKFLNFKSEIIHLNYK